MCKVRAWAYMLASGKSWLTPAPPCAWIARSMTQVATSGTATLIAWISRSVTGSRTGRPVLPVLLQLPAGEGPPVHLVRSVDDVQSPGVGVHVGQREVLADPGAAVRLDRAIDDPGGDFRNGHLDRLDL